MTGLKLKPRLDLPNWISKSCKVKYQKFQDYRQIYETLFKWRFNQQSKGWLGINGVSKRCNLLFHSVSLHTLVYLFPKTVIFLKIIITFKRYIFKVMIVMFFLDKKKYIVLFDLNKRHCAFFGHRWYTRCLQRLGMYKDGICHVMQHHL